MDKLYVLMLDTGVDTKAPGPQDTKSIKSNSPKASKIEFEEDREK